MCSSSPPRWRGHWRPTQRPSSRCGDYSDRQSTLCECADVIFLSLSSALSLPFFSALCMVDVSKFHPPTLKCTENTQQTARNTAQHAQFDTLIVFYCSLRTRPSLNGVHTTISWQTGDKGPQRAILQVAQVYPCTISHPTEQQWKCSTAAARSGRAQETRRIG